jgi:hypothetical protein
MMGKEPPQEKEMFVEKKKVFWQKCFFDAGLRPGKAQEALKQGDQIERIFAILGGCFLCAAFSKINEPAEVFWATFLHRRLDIL